MKGNKISVTAKLDFPHNFKVGDKLEIQKILHDHDVELFAAQRKDVRVDGGQYGWSGIKSVEIPNTKIVAKKGSSKGFELVLSDGRTVSQDEMFNQFGYKRMSEIFDKN